MKKLMRDVFGPNIWGSKIKKKRAIGIFHCL